MTAAVLDQRPPVAPSFVARRKIGEKGVPRGCGPLNPRGNVLGHSDVLCANRFATVRLTRLSRLRRSAYPLASACCTAVEWLALTQPPNLRPQITLVIFQCQRIRRTTCSKHESGGSSAFGNVIAEKRWCLAFRRSRVKRTPPARRRAGLNRVNCTRAHT